MLAVKLKYSRCSAALADDMETARTEYEVLVAQLAEEQDSGDRLSESLRVCGRHFTWQLKV